MILLFFMKLILVQGIRGHRVTGMFRLVIHIRNAYYWCNLLLSTKWFAKLNHHSLCTVCAKGHAISRVYNSHKRSSHLVSYRSKKKTGKALMALSFCTWMSWIWQSTANLPQVECYLCSPSGKRGPGVWLIGCHDVQLLYMYMYVAVFQAQPLWDYSG